MTSPTLLVLASGRGERFTASGGSGSKLHAMLAGRRVIDHTLDAVRASDLPWHVEDAGHAGMGDSIAAAVRATRESQGWLVLPGDLPLVSAGSLRAVAALIAQHPIVVPFHRGAKGHPVGFSRGCLDELLALHGEEGAAGIVRAHAALGEVFRLELADEGIAIDIDTLDDLRKLEQRLAKPR